MKKHVKAPTPQAREQYIRTGGARCPLCGSEQIEGDAFQCESGTAWQTIRCLECGGEWNDVYTLANIEHADWPNEPLQPSPKTGAARSDRKQLLVDLGGVDWRLLRRQKESLIRAISIVDVQIGKKCQHHLQGILHLLDHIQDEAAQELGEAAVFQRNKAAGKYVSKEVKEK